MQTVLSLYAFAEHDVTSPGSKTGVIQTGLTGSGLGNASRP